MGAGPAGLTGPLGEWDWNRILTPRIVLFMVPVVGLFVWSYWKQICGWELVWRSNSAWGHGYLIPVIAVLIAHFRLKELNPRRIEPCIWGLVIVMAGFFVRVCSEALRFGYPQDITFLLVSLGIVLLLLGWEMFRALWIPVLYLGLMIPWSPKYYDQLALPLQTLSAWATERFLGVLGMGVTRDGNVIRLPSGPLTVAEACSGLHLLFAFVALGVMMAYLYRRAVWERLLIMGSSVPIAVFCNFIRVTLMAIASDKLFFESQAAARGAATWSDHLPDVFWNLFRGANLPERLASFRETVLNPESFLHQSFGFAMLGLAFLIMWAELRLIDLLFVEDGTPSSPRAGPAGYAYPRRRRRWWEDL